ncbi:hypothetical protein KY321_01565, partial [Candidatus Woesearchaeota archaeon]|nr:hypothetical protein [Candidatus Woesearchaeota archaeon]
MDKINDIYQHKNQNSNIIPTRIDYVSDIIKKISKTKSDLRFEQTKFDIPSAFINPTINTDPISTETSSSSPPSTATKKYVVEWFEDISKPILVLLGKGGVGKTTIAEYFSNMILEEYQDTSNIFIDSVEIRSKIKKHNGYEFLSLYDIYKESIQEKNVLDEYYFTKNLEYNNFFIIIDGIDELISKVPNFDIKRFLESITSINNQIENSKIIISCRSEYWNIVDDNIQLIELEAFDVTQMDSFFKKIFPTEDTKFKRAIDLANEFHNNKFESVQGNKYHPYALDLISSIIKRNIHLKDDLETVRLNTNIKTDYIIAKLCFREKFHTGKPRVTDLSIDEQVKILEYIAIAHNGKINQEEIKEAVFFGINKNLDKNIQDVDYVNYGKSLLSHPLLKFDGSTKNTSFAYDFFTDIFKAIYIAYNLSNENLLDEVKVELLRFIADFKFESQILHDISNRVNQWGDSNKTNLALLIDLIREDKTIENIDKTKLYSGLFNLAYAVNKKFLKEPSPNKKTNTELLRQISIIKGNKVTNLCLNDIIEEKLFFDFSDITQFENCVFNNYSSFWDISNEWNKDVFFKNCKFQNLGKRSSSKEIEWTLDDNYKNFGINSQKFMDEEFREQIKNNKQITDELKNEIEKLINQFIHFFWDSPNTFYAQNYTVRDSACRTPLIAAFSKFSSL